MIEYFCTECEKDVKPQNVHINYGFVKKYKFNSKGLYIKTICVKNKNLCMCKDCFQNYAVLNINNYPNHYKEHFAEYVHERGF